MPNFLLVKDLVRLLKRYDDDAVIMLGWEDEDTENVVAVDAEDDVSYMFRSDEGEVYDEEDSELGESRSPSSRRAVVLWKRN